MQAIHITYLRIRVPLGVLGDAVVVGQLQHGILLFGAVPHHGQRILQHKRFSNEHTCDGTHNELMSGQCS
jgi:hypothetical protein